VVAERRGTPAFGIDAAAQDDPQTLDRVWAMLERLVRQGVVERLPGAVANSHGLRRGDAEGVVTRALDATCLQVARGQPVYRPDQYLTKAVHREAKRTKQRQAGFETVDPDEVDPLDRPVDLCRAEVAAETVQRVRALVSRIPWEKPRLAWEVVFEAYDAGLVDLPAREDDGLINANPVHKVRAPEQPVDPEQVFGETRRRAYTPEEAGQLLAHFPSHWHDHVICLLGTGLRFGEFAGLCVARVHLDREPPVLQVVNVAYYAGRFGRGIKDRPKSPASVREVPLPSQVVQAIRRQLPVRPPGASPLSPLALVFAGPGGANGVARGSRSELWRRNFERTYHRAIAKLTDPAAATLRPSAARVAKNLRVQGPATVAELAERLAAGGRALAPASIQTALEELEAVGLAAPTAGKPGPDDPGREACWAAVTPPKNRILDGLELHGPHDFRHTYATWLEDAGIPSRVIDELMGHAQSGRGRSERGSVIGRRYRHTTPEMAARVVGAIEARLAVVLAVAARPLPEPATPDGRRGDRSQGMPPGLR
jgi:integrase